MRILKFISVLFSSILLGYSQAFPTALGAGKNATGGRGGTVIHVTNRNSSGAGSLANAIKTTGARIIVFDVSGNFNLPSGLDITGSSYNNITIAGQTAPLGGVTITGGSQFWWNKVDNIIIRYVRFRQFPTTGGGTPDITGDRDEVEHMGGNNIIYDHCSFSFGTDEAISFVAATDDRMENVTLQRSLIGNSKTGSIMGTGDGYVSMVGPHSYILNLLTDTNHRFPNFAGNSRLDVINNVVFNWLNRIVNTNGGSSQVNVVNNYNKEGTYMNTNPNNLDMYNKIQSPSSQRIYSAGNKREKPDGSLRPAPNAFYEFNSPGAEFGSPYMVGSAYSYLDPSYTILSADEAYTEVLSNVGANRYIDDSGYVQVYQDTYDTAKISNVQTKTYGQLSGQSFSDWVVPTIPTNSRSMATFDSDNDGMSDAWEIREFGNLSKTANGTDLHATYTNIEIYFNQVDGTAPAPTCSDGIQNGDETGIDCGGSCSPCGGIEPGTGAGARAFMNYLLTN